MAEAWLELGNDERAVELKLTFLPLFLNGTVTGAFHKILLVDSP